MATLLKIGQSHVSLIEAGKRKPSHRTITQLSRELRIPQSLISLLAADPQDLEVYKSDDIDSLARSLLDLIVAASEVQPQKPLPFTQRNQGKRKE